MLKKIIQLNSDIQGSMEYGTLSLDAAETALLEALLLEIGNPSNIASKFTGVEWHTVNKVAFKWPEHSRFPGMLMLMKD